MMHSTLLINEPPLQVIPSLAAKFGLKQAIVLQQIHYWLNPKFCKNNFEERLWVHKTYEQWGKQFPFWGDKTIRRVMQSLERANLITSFLKSDGFRKTKFYTINYEFLGEFKAESKTPIDLDETHETDCGGETHLSGQYEQIDTPKIADSEGQDDLMNMVNMTKAKMGKRTSERVFHLSGQYVQIVPPKRAEVSGQDDPMKVVNVTESYMEGENTRENTFLLLPPQDEEEENKFLEVWNKIIQEKLKPSSKVYLTLKRSKAFAATLEIFFQNDLGRWRTYCVQVSNCKFLMGESKSGFRATFDWAIKPDNVVKILEGAIYDQDSLAETPKQKPWPEFERGVRIHIKQKSLPKMWFHIIQMIVPIHGQGAYESWLKDLDVCIELKEVTLTAPSAFIKNRVELLFGHDLKHAFAKLLGIEEVVYLVVRPLPKRVHPT